MPPPARPPLNPSEPLSGDLNLPSWAYIQRTRGDDPDELLNEIAEMLAALPDEVASEVVGTMLQRVAQTYAADLGVEIPDRWTSGWAEGRESVRPRMGTPVNRILWDLNDLGRKSNFSSGTHLDQALERGKHHYDMRSDRSRFFGLDENAPPGLARFYTALGGWMEHDISRARPGLLIGGVGALLEREGFRPSYVGLVALPRAGADRKWAGRFDEILREHMGQVAAEDVASLEVGFPVDWNHVPELVAQLVGEAPGRSAGVKRILFTAAEVAVQMALDNPQPDVAPEYLGRVQQVLDNYLSPLTEGGPYRNPLREWGSRFLADTPEPSYGEGYGASRAAYDLIEAVIEMPRKRDLVDAVARVIYRSASLADGAPGRFIAPWWAAVRNRIPIRTGRGDVTGRRSL